VIVLLAPSEGKTPAPADAPPVDLETLAFPALTERRRMLVTRLERLATGPRRRALAALGLSEAQSGELERDADLLGSPAAPAGGIYSGVLYQHLDLPSLPPAARRRAAERLYVASALWGVVSIADRIPAYRLSMGASLPRIPSLARWWRPSLAAALPADAFVVDLRSAAYAAAWRPARGTVVEVKAFSEAGGVRRPISHMAKAVRGEVARMLVGERRAPGTPEEVAALVEAAGERVALRPPANRGTAWSLELVRG
jgi:cytoplasmic iron level regulating protein YaaA (DUF328/UPF0246 family)